VRLPESNPEDCQPGFSTWANFWWTPSTGRELIIMSADELSGEGPPGVDVVADVLKRVGGID